MTAEEAAMGKGKRVKERRRAERAQVAVNDAWTPPPKVTPERWTTTKPDTCTGLRALALERDEARQALNDVERAVTEDVVRARLEGANWAEIGAALGISRQAARQRFGME